MLGPSDSSYNIPTRCGSEKKFLFKHSSALAVCFPASIIPGSRGAVEEGAADLAETVDVRRW
jgi:hypothetical protein